MTLEHRPVIAGRVARARRRLGWQSRRLTGCRLRHVVSSDRCHGSSVDTPLYLLRMLMFSAICLLVWAAAFSSLSAQQPASGRPEATSLTGVPLYIPRLPNVDKLAADLDAAQKTLAANPNDPEAVIWVGRRYGFWRFLIDGWRADGLLAG